MSVILLSYRFCLSASVLHKWALRVIDGMVGFMYATVPVLITLVVSGGNITTGGVFQPVMLMVVEVSATVIKNIFIPLIFLSTILNYCQQYFRKGPAHEAGSFYKADKSMGTGNHIDIIYRRCVPAGVTGRRS